jgi:hypothetical protein
MGNWTRRATSTTRGVVREYGLWSVSRSLSNQQNGVDMETVWALYGNEVGHRGSGCTVVL